MEKRINICISASDKYIELGAITLNSVVYHANPDTIFSFYIIDNGISKKNHDRVLSLFDKKNTDVFFINAKDIEKDAGMKIDPGHWTLSTLQRLYISEFLPESLHRVIYLDCDLLVRGPLDEVYDTDLGEETIVAGVEDCISLQNRKNIGLEEHDKYINAGILLIDLDRWRDFDIGRKSLIFLKNNIQYLQFFDQDILNAVLKGKIKVLPLKYNVHTVIFNYKYNEMMRYRNTNNFYTEKECQEALENPVIVHFTMDTVSIRPWYVNGTHKYREEWISIRNLTPWRNEPLWKDDRSISTKAKRCLFKMLPKNISVSLASFVNRRHSKKHSH